MVRNRHYSVVVIGDVGRSPRMCLHALSLAENDTNCTVSLVGYLNTELGQKINSCPQIRPVGIPPPLEIFNYLPSTLNYAIKTLWIATFLALALLFRVGLRCDALLFQNPPAFPALAVCSFYIRYLCGGNLFVDWHNYSHSVLRVSLEARGKRNASNHWMVKYINRFEGSWAKTAKLCLCVSNAMKGDIRKRYNINPLTLYDRPANWKFSTRKLDLDDRHNLMHRLAFEKQYKPFQDKLAPNGYDEQGAEVNRFTYRESGSKAQLRDDRPALIVSSTSWTHDENFGILLDALIIYDRNFTRTEGLPCLVCVITGKGPEKAYYMEKINKLTLKHVEIVCPWLDAEDYPNMLLSCDLGVCLHTSTSGVDLPMKVVDMFGCRLPVLAKRYEAISELVQNNYNGLLFTDNKQLSKQLLTVLAGFPNNSKQLDIFRKFIDEQPFVAWEDNWHANAWPLIRND